MLTFIILALLIALLRGYKLSALKKGYALIPLLVMMLAYVSLQLLVLNGHYEVVVFTRVIQISFIVSLIPAILFYKIYIPAIVGAFLSIFGSLLNRLAIDANGGLMPVYATLSRYTGYYNEAEMLNDGIHCLFTEASVYKPLCDIIDIGYSIMSVGDVFLHSFFAIIVYFSVVALNKQNNTADG